MKKLISILLALTIVLLPMANVYAQSENYITEHELKEYLELNSEIVKEIYINGESYKYVMAEDLPEILQSRSAGAIVVKTLGGYI